MVGIITLPMVPNARITLKIKPPIDFKNLLNTNDRPAINNDPDVNNQAILVKGRTAEKSNN